MRRSHVVRSERLTDVVADDRIQARLSHKSGGAAEDPTATCIEPFYRRPTPDPKIVVRCARHDAGRTLVAKGAASDDGRHPEGPLVGQARARTGPMRRQAWAVAPPPIWPATPKP
jgi:hypothetical protein